MRLVLSLLILTFPVIHAGEQPELPYGIVVLPIVLEQNTVEHLDWEPGAEYWVAVEYLTHPQGEPVFVETAEQVWWFQDMAVLFLGASGDVVPSKLLSRGTCWVRIMDAGTPLRVAPFKVHPRKDRLRLSSDPNQVKYSLAKVLPGVDASYLAQVAHYLAGNLVTLDVQGTSYTVSGYGEVINNSGEWTGVPVPDEQHLFETITGDTGVTIADTENDTFTIVGSGIASTSIVGDTLTVTATETDGDATNELQNLFQIVTGNTGSTTANSQTDTLSVVGTGSVSTTILGDMLTITGSGLTAEVDDSTTNELQNLFHTVSGDTGSTSADSQTDTLTITGSGLVSTSIAGDNMTIDAEIGNDSLDFAQLSDTLTVDATTSLNLNSNDADLNFDSDTFMIDASTNRIGIGTATPQALLEVAGGNILQSPGNPTLAGFLAIGASPKSVVVSGRYAYVVDFGSDDLKVIDVSGAEVTALPAHSLEAGNLQVRNDITAQGQLSVAGGVNIWSGGLFSDGNVGISGTLAIANDIAPTSSPANTVQLFAEDVTGSELKVRDEAGNITTLSPHNFSLIGTPSEPMAWSFYSQNGDQTINVDMLKTFALWNR